MEPLKKVGKYLFLEEQERTDLAAVWRAADLANGKIDHYYLADLISLKLALDPGFLDHYLNQSLMVSKLEHPNILRKVKTTNENGALVSFYEYQEGFSLAAVLDRCLSDGFPFSIDHGLLVVSKLLSALAYAKSKHMTHGFVNPAVVFVTHEGEIKLKGFALSSSFRNCASGLPDLRAVFGKYVPPGKDITDDNRDKLDIYGCGAILFEMLTGESFQDQSGDPASVIANATTAALGESIPTQIANILISSLDPTAPSAYADIQKMAKDMDELLFSGEYSPTTFNLAFFMHSAFRNEMDELNEKLGTEKETDYSKQAIEEAAPAAPALPTPPPAAAPAPPPGGYNEPPVQAAPVQAAAPTESGKSKMPIIIGAVAVALIIGIGAVFVLKPKDAGSGSKFEEQAKQIEDDRAKEVAAEAARREEELRIQNQQLKALVQQQQEEEREAKRKQLENDMRKMDEEIARIKEQEEEAKQRKQLQAELDRLKQEREQVEAKQREAQEEAERQAKAEADALAQKEAAKKEAEAKAAAEAAQADAPSTEMADAGAPSTAPSPSETVEKPNPGDIVDLEVLLDAPVLLEPYKPLPVPKKALRAGAVKKRGSAMFLMKILIDEEGKVEDAQVSRNPIPGDDDYGMTDKAVKAAKRLRFSRPTHMDVPVKVWTFAAIHFRDN